MRLAQSIAAVAAVAAVLLWGGPTAGSVEAEPAALDSAAEVARVRAHLLRVEWELRDADVSHLTDEQRSARAAHLDRLHAYALAGVFPHNHDVPDRRVPVFVDDHGTHCAVGHLMAMSGEEALVRRISAERNLERVPDLADVPGVAEWLTSAGLSVEEAAAIQPAYGPIVDPDFEDDRSAYETATLIGTGLGGASAVWSLMADRGPGSSRLAGALGTGLGAAQIGLGVAGFGIEGDPVFTIEGDPFYRGADIDDRFTYTNLAMGALTLALGIRALTVDHGADGDDDRSRGGGRRGAAAEDASVRVSPYVGDRGSAGLRLDVRF